MKTVFRVQNKLGKGYLNSKFQRSKDKLYLNNWTERQQHPDADGTTDLANFVLSNCSQMINYIFGFEKLEHILIWFRFEELISLKKDGFYIYEIDIREDSIIYGSRQLIFQKPKTLTGKIFKIDLNIELWKNIDEKYFKMSE